MGRLNFDRWVALLDDDRLAEQACYAKIKHVLPARGHKPFLRLIAVIIKGAAKD